MTDETTSGARPLSDEERIGLQVFRSRYLLDAEFHAATYHYVTSAERTIDTLRRERTALDRVEDAARGWAVAWDATHGKALPMPLTLDQREMLRRRDVAEENLREAIRALAALDDVRSEEKP